MVKDKKQMQIEQQIIYNLVQVMESFPQYTLAQHLWHVLRTKGYEKEPYFWDDIVLLSKMESYYNELNEELIKEEHAS